MNLGFGNFDFEFMIAFRWPLGMCNEGFRWVGGINEGLMTGKLLFGDGTAIVQKGEEK